MFDNAIVVKDAVIQCCYSNYFGNGVFIPKGEHVIVKSSRLENRCVVVMYKGYNVLILEENLERI